MTEHVAGHDVPICLPDGLTTQQLQEFKPFNASISIYPTDPF